MTKNYTKDEIIELFVCSKDLMYFAEKYIIRAPLDIKQRLWLNCSLTDKYVKFNTERFTFRTSTLIARAIWQAFFNNDTHTVFVCVNARDISQVYKQIIDLVESNRFSPDIYRLNRSEIQFNNGSRISFCSSSNINMLRGRTLDLLLLDNTDQYKNKNLAEIRNITYPAIGTRGKVIEV